MSHYPLRPPSYTLTQPKKCSNLSIVNTSSLLAPPPAILVVWLDMLNCILNLPEHTFSKRTIISQKSAGAKKVFVLLYENEYAYTRKRIIAKRENGQCRKENLYLSIDLPLCFLISTTLNSTAINFGGISFDVYLGFSFALLRN